MDLVFLSRGRDLTKTTVSVFNKDNDWLSILPSSIVYELNLSQVPCSVMSILQNFSFHQTNKKDMSESVFRHFYAGNNRL